VSVCVVLNVSSLDRVDVVDAVCGAPKDVAKDVCVGNVMGDVVSMGFGGTIAVVPMERMIREDLVGRFSISSRVMGGNSAHRMASTEM
jgi:hypothetical protein